MRIWSFLKDFIQSKHIQLALVSGASIVALAFFSKRVLPAPIDNTYLTIPALLVVAAEGMLGAKKKAWYTKTTFWLALIVLVTTLIIVIHLI